jgi:TetR/AcrR family transcriptional regulator
MSWRSSARTKSRRHEEVRAKIFEAAEAAIAENGYHGMSMRGLARAALMSLANYYNYFSSKEDLLLALQTHAFQNLITTAEKALDGMESPVAGLYVFIYNHVRYVADHRAVMRVLIHEASALPAARRKAIRVLKERYFRIGRELVMAIAAEGCRNPGAGGAGFANDAEIERATYSIFGMLNWSYGWYEPKQHGSPHEVAATIHRVALCGLVTNCPHRPIQQQMEQQLAATAPPLNEYQELRESLEIIGPR